MSKHKKPENLPTTGGRWVRDTPNGEFRRTDKKAQAEAAKAKAEAKAEAKADAKTAPADKPAKNAK